MLNDDQKLQIRNMRRRRWSVTAMAERLGLPVGEVATYADTLPDHRGMVKSRMSPGNVKRPKPTLAPVRGI